MAPEGIEFRMISLEKLPVYNQDFDEPSECPETYTAFRKELGDAQGFIFVTPEHNRSMPAAMKNALDIGSRPHGQNQWKGKPGLVISSSPGAVSGFGAHHHLRQVLVSLDVPVVPQPEVYLSKINEAFNEEGSLVNEKMKSFLQKAIDAYMEWFKKLT